MMSAGVTNHADGFAPRRSYLCGPTLGQNRALQKPVGARRQPHQWNARSREHGTRELSFSRGVMIAQTLPTRAGVAVQEHDARPRHSAESESARSK